MTHDEVMILQRPLGFILETSWVVPDEGFVSLEAQVEESKDGGSTAEIVPSTSSGPSQKVKLTVRPAPEMVSEKAVTAVSPSKKPTPKPFKKPVTAEPPLCHWWNAKLSEQSDPFGDWQPAEPVQKPTK